jgi:hypothetical protein
MQHLIDTQQPPPGESESNTGRLAGATSNTGILGTRPDHRQKSVSRDAPNPATKQMTQNVHLKMGRKTGCQRNKKQLAGRCENILIEGTAVNSPYNIQELSVECLITTVSLPVMGILQS